MYFFTKAKPSVAASVQPVGNLIHLPSAAAQSCSSGKKERKNDQSVLLELHYMLDRGDWLSLAEMRQASRRLPLPW
jgi:hypothetical protein